jgi:hypothetical protein
MQCKICNKEFDKLESLFRHLMKKHSLSSQSVYNEYTLNNNIPTCKCGCGEVPIFRGFTKGYGEWIRGHVSRVKNNWGHNEAAINKSSETRKNQYESGERKVWNDGLTKDTDERVKLYSLKSSNTLRTNQTELIRRSIWLSDARKNTESFKTKYGKEAANWKGGTSSINNIIRANKRLYEKWKYPILKASNFECVKCNSTNNLEVHHNNQTMSEIIQKFVDKNKEYTFDEKRDIMNNVIEYHIDNSISGEVLCRDCHKELHPSYNT